MKHENLWDIKRLSQFLGRPIGSLRQSIHHRPSTIPPYIRIGRTLRWRPDAVYEWVKRQEGWE